MTQPDDQRLVELIHQGVLTPEEYESLTGKPYADDTSDQVDLEAEPHVAAPPIAFSAGSFSDKGASHDASGPVPSATTPVGSDDRSSSSQGGSPSPLDSRPPQPEVVKWIPGIVASIGAILVVIHTSGAITNGPGGLQPITIDDAATAYADWRLYGESGFDLRGAYFEWGFGVCMVLSIASAIAILAVFGLAASAPKRAILAGIAAADAVAAVWSAASIAWFLGLLFDAPPTATAILGPVGLALCACGALGGLMIQESTA